MNQPFKNNQLRPYQQADVDLLSQQKAIAIFNEMRTGKTPTALAIFEKWPVQNLLIICPATLQIHWQKSVENWLNKPAKIISGLSPNQRLAVYERFSWPKQKDWIIIVSKDTFKRDANIFKIMKAGWQTSFCVIVDEGHFLRSHKSDQSKSIYTLNPVEYKMVLTGTPMVNHAADIFGILHFLKPTEYNSYDNFIQEYFWVSYFKRQIELTRKDGTTWKFTLTIPKVLGYRSQTKKNQLQTILNQFSTQRTQKETMPWLSEVDYQQVDLALTPEQRNIYDKWMEDWDINHPLELLTRLKTLILYPPAVVKYQETIDEDTTIIYPEQKENLTEEEKELMKGCLGVKFTYLLDFCQQAKSQSLLIFSTRSQTFLIPLAEKLREKELKVGLITGATSLKERQRLVEAFQSQTINILLCNIISAGVGLNLSQADVVIFADRAWSPADNEQAEDRFLPIQSQDVKPKLVIDLVCGKTIDVKVIELLKKKQDITQLILKNPGVLFE